MRRGRPKADLKSTEVDREILSRWARRPKTAQAAGRVEGGRGESPGLVSPSCWPALSDRCLAQAAISSVSRQRSSNRT